MEWQSGDTFCGEASMIIFFFFFWWDPHSLGDGYSAMSCNFVVLAGEDERMSFYSVILYVRKLGKEYVKVVYCHPAYLTSIQSTS